MEECRRCLLLESSKEDVFKAIREHLEKIPPKEKASDELYQKRLDICRLCDDLVSGTCIKCGCYVEFRAAFINRKCPDVRSKKW